jgi:ligand-binding sensor domain-containing protein
MRIFGFFIYCLIFGFFSMANAQVKKIEIPDNWYAFTFQETSDSTIWIGLSDGNTSGALAFYQRGTLTLIEDNPSAPLGSYHNSLKLPDGSVMFGGNILTPSKKSLLVWVSSGSIDSIGIPFTLPNSFVTCISLVNRREIWIGTASGLLINNRGNWSRLTIREGLPDNFINSIYQDFRGIVWIGTEQGVASHFENQLKRVEQGSRIISSATTFFGDSRGYVWCGSRFSSDGISVFNGEIWDTFSGRHGLIDNSASIFYQDDNGLLWVGSCYNRSRGGVSVFNGHKWEGYTEKEALAKPCVDAIISDKQGRVWLGGSLTPRRGKGVTVVDGDSWQIISNPELPADRVITFFVDSSGNIWISSFEGLFVVSPNFII